jgi:hypothetical protein
MYRFRYKQLVLILTMGIGLGLLVPTLLTQFPLKLMNEVSPAYGGIDSASTEHFGEIERDEDSFGGNSGIVSEQKKLFAIVQDERLSIIEDNPGGGNVLLSGIDIKDWPQDMQELATKIEFHSLDEVQSFIDSMSEELWIE